MSELLFDGEETITALRALADLLEEARVPHQDIIIVGGSYLAILNLRRATRDVDSITRVESATKQAIADVGHARATTRNGSTMQQLPFTQSVSRSITAPCFSNILRLPFSVRRQIGSFS